MIPGMRLPVYLVHGRALSRGVPAGELFGTHREDGESVRVRSCSPLRAIAWRRPLIILSEQFVVTSDLDDGFASIYRPVA
jgi:hypothetical protein